MNQVVRMKMLIWTQTMLDMRRSWETEKEMEDPVGKDHHFDEVVNKNKMHITFNMYVIM